jgi:hypothetical protein
MTKKELKEAREDINHLQYMLEKAFKELVRKQNIIDELISSQEKKNDDLLLESHLETRSKTEAENEQQGKSEIVDTHPDNFLVTHSEISKLPKQTINLFNHSYVEILEHEYRLMNRRKKHYMDTARIGNTFWKIDKKGCGKEIPAFGDTIVCGGVDGWICDKCKSSSKQKSPYEEGSLQDEMWEDIQKAKRNKRLALSKHFRNNK